MAPSKRGAMDTGLIFAERDPFHGGGDGRSSMTMRRRPSCSLIAAWSLFATPAAVDASASDDSLPNVFISPCGQPFRARIGAPYPVADWFKGADKNGDGRLDRAEFVADAEAFFKTLDRNGDGVLNHYEVAVYEQRVAPEILGIRVIVGAANGAASLRLAQYNQSGPIDPSGDQPAAPVAPKGLDESGQGASPFGFFEEPEPVMTANFDLNGMVRKANFLKVAGMHFEALDTDGAGYLTLAKLPKTPIQKLIGKPRRGRSKS